MDTSDEGGNGLRNRSDLRLRPLPVALLVVAAWMVLTGILMGVGTLVVHSGSVQGFDNHVTSVFVSHRSPVLNAAMKAVTWLGSWVAELVAAAVVLLLVLRHRLSVGFLLLAVAAWVGAQGGTTLAKHVVERPDPPNPCDSSPPMAGPGLQATPAPPRLSSQSWRRSRGCSSQEPVQGSWQPSVGSSPQ